jgi:uncharacterized membrane protein
MATPNYRADRGLDLDEMVGLILLMVLLGLNAVLLSFII